MDFYRICVREIEKGPNKGSIEVYPDFVVGRTKDLMIRGKSFYAVWDEENQLWSTDEYDVQRMVDKDVVSYANEQESKTGIPHIPKTMRSMNSGIWVQFRKYMSNISDNAHELDSKLTFANSEVKKTDYVSKRLPYALEPGDISAWDELVGTLYNVEERAKIEWIIGAIVSGDSTKIQKFGVFYGPPASGKSTILNICMDLFAGYTTAFEAKALASNNGAFATEVFRSNPLVGIQQDGDLSKIEDNARMNSIIAHEPMTMNEKYKPAYTAAILAFLLMGTNQPVKITDAKSGIIRRLIDIHPTGVSIPTNHYFTLLSRVEFEHGAIAHHCLQVYREMGKNYYNGYRPLEMMLQTDVFFNFIEYWFHIFKDQNFTTLKQAYKLYKEFCDETGIDRPLPQYKVREELRNYFDVFKEKHTEDGVTHRSYYQGFNASKFKQPTKEESASPFSLVMEEEVSLFDEMAADWPAQYEIEDDDGVFRPQYKWENVKTTLKDLDTSKVHYVKVPEDHIVIDFDLKSDNGRKSLELNLEAASGWPATYGELSKSGEGIHLHYDYDGDVSALAKEYSNGIEVKTLLGNAALRRRLSHCNNVPVAKIPVGRLPEKEKKVLAEKTMKSERALRDLIIRALQKDINPGTKTNIDFIKHILDEAYDSGMEYDVSDMKSSVFAFANASSNQSLLAIKTAMKMKWKSDGSVESTDAPAAEDQPLTFYDLEVYPNLFSIGWKYEDAPPESTVKMLNPSPAECEELLKHKLVGFYNRRYDNHILYARTLGYTNEQLYQLSQKIVNNNTGAYFPAAYNISYADVYDYANVKMTLKKWQIELGITHKEMDIPWDQPVPDDRVQDVLDYMVNDVVATEAVHKARKGDFNARQILASLSGASVNDTTQKHTSLIIFGKDKNPQSQFNYTHLREMFPGYKYEAGKSTYKGEDVGEGGYVYAEPGMYEDVALLDVASMHPTSIIQLNLFGNEYTKKFKNLVDTRVAIKRGEFERAKKLLPGVEPYLNDREAKDLSDALKIVINIVYGLTAAKFDNSFRDIRNKDNIVAKRGALFMVDLKQFVQEKGYTVAHIKTDSIKIPNADQYIIDQVTKFGAQYGYEFEHEATYEKFCLVNDAVYIARKRQDEGDPYSPWEAVGAQFQHPYVYKTLFSGEKIVFQDFVEAKSVVKGGMYLDFDYDKPMALATKERMKFVGKTGRFVPVVEGMDGAVLYRITDDKPYAVAGTKGHLWLEADVVEELGEKATANIDLSYFQKLVDAAIDTIKKFGEFESFVR